MKIQVNSDRNIAVDAAVTRFVRGEVNRALERFKAKLTRVEVHLSDVNSFKSGKQDKRCMVEARPAGHRPLVATMSSANIDAAVKGSLNKLRNALDTFFGRTGRTRKVTRQSEPQTAPAVSKKRSARKTAKRPASKKKATATSATNQSPQSGRSPKRKGIYQARRKSWPRR